MFIEHHALPLGFTDKLVNTVPVTLGMSHNNTEQYNYFLDFFKYTLECEGKNTRVVSLTEQQSTNIEHKVNRFLEAMEYALHTLFTRDLANIHCFYEDDTLKNHPYFIDYAMKSFADKQYSLIGRFDLAIDNNANIVGVYEYNGDTPVMLFESLYQQDFMTKHLTGDNYAQFNELYPSITEIFKKLKSKNNSMVFAAVASDTYLDDFVTAEVLTHAAYEAGINETYLLSLEELFFEQKGITSNEHRFFYENSQGQEIELTDIFILYPWEDLLDDVPLAFAKWQEWYNKIRFYEPPYKWFMAHKGFLAYMTFLMENDKHFKQYYSDIPLIPTYTYFCNMKEYVAKPVLGRCGNNIKFYKDYKVLTQNYDGTFGHLPDVYQPVVPEISIDGRKIIACVWTCTNLDNMKLSSETLAFREYPSDEFPQADNEYYLTHIIKE